MESEIPVRFYYDLGASTVLLLRSCRFCYDSCHFDLNFESYASGIGGFTEVPKFDMSLHLRPYFTLCVRLENGMVRLNMHSHV